MAKITYSFEDAIQIYHRSSSTIEVFEPLVAEEDWQGFRPDAIRRTEDYFSDDELLDFDQFTKEQYAEKVGSVEGKPDDAFPVLVAVRKAREAE